LKRGIKISVSELRKKLRKLEYGDTVDLGRFLALHPSPLDTDVFISSMRLPKHYIVFDDNWRHYLTLEYDVTKHLLYVKYHGKVRAYNEKG